MITLQDKFQSIISAHETRLAHDTKISDIFGYAKLAAVVAVVVCIVLLFTSSFAAGIALLTAAVFALTIFLWVCHYRIDNKIKYAKGICQICKRHIARITGEWSTFPDTGQEFIDLTHPYACDLDIVGAKSLFQFLNTTHTWHGRQAFANDLLCPQYNPQQIAGRQAAIAELAGDIDFANDMEFFLSQIGAGTQDANFVEELADSKVFIKSVPVKFLISYMPVATVLLLAGGAIFQARPVLIAGLVCIVLQQILCWLSGAKPALYLGIMNRMPYKLGRYAAVMETIATRNFTSQRLEYIRTVLQSGRSAVKELESIGNKLSVIANPLVYILLNLLLLWDFHCAFLLERWKEKHAKNVPAWFAAIGEFESLLAFSHLPNVCEGTALPSVTDVAKTLAATALGHPLLPNGSRVCNDFRMGNNIFIISGSNMSGKTTFMRTVGVNLVLARAGSFVCAGGMSCSIFDIVTSMRISDDLNQGVSTFYAELTRVKGIIDAAKENPATLFLIDEIFKGTNSVDRLAGADAVIATLERLGAVGMVSTHDLELCKLADIHDRILNFSFSENYKDGKINFSYKMQPGKSQTTNAKFLMEMVGITKSTGCK